MKVIFIVAIVGMVMQCISCYEKVYPIDVDEHRFTNDFERTLYNQFYRRMSDVIMSWFTCKKMFKAPRAQSFHIFQNPVSSPEPQYQRSAKCLMDCTMRRTGVMTDYGLDEDEYMKQIKQMRYNYTSFDRNTKSKEMKKLIEDTIIERASRLIHYETREPDSFTQAKCENIPPFRNHCYDLLLSYAEAAHECKNLKDPDGDNCETSWMVMRCIMEKNRSNLFNSPFFPVFAADTIKPMPGYGTRA